MWTFAVAITGSAPVTTSNMRVSNRALSGRAFALYFGDPRIVQERRDCTPFPYHVLDDIGQDPPLQSLQSPGCPCPIAPPRLWGGVRAARPFADHCVQNGYELLP